MIQKLPHVAYSQATINGSTTGPGQAAESGLVEVDAARAARAALFDAVAALRAERDHYADVQRWARAHGA